MFGARQGFCAAAVLLAQLAFAGATRASDAAITVVVSASTLDARLSRALVLIRGELSALGLEVQVRAVDADAAPSAAESSEQLSLEVKDGAVVVRVFAPGAAAPLVESVELDGAEVTAEVIAVRAVEALRAARLLPPTAQRSAAPHPPVEHRLAQQSPAEQSAVRHPSTTSTASPVPTVQLSLGPTLVQNAQGLPLFSARAALLVGPSFGFVAAGGETSLSRVQFERAVGSAHISRRTLFLQLGARARLQQAWQVSAQAGLHYLHYTASGVADPGYVAQDLKHDTAGVSLSFGGAYYFFRAFGVYLDLSGLVAFDAARVRLGDESVVTLDRPSFSVGTGVILGAF